jgi:hypothetical protein
LDEILVLAHGPGAIQNDTVTFGCKPVFVRVYRYGGHAWTAEVKATGFCPWGSEACAGEVGHEEGAEAAVDVEGDGVGDCETGEGGDLVDDAMGVVGRGADEEDRVRIYEAAEFGD